MQNSASFAWTCQSAVLLFSSGQAETVFLKRIKERYGEAVEKPGFLPPFQVTLASRLPAMDILKLHRSSTLAVWVKAILKTLHLFSLYEKGIQATLLWSS